MVRSPSQVKETNLLKSLNSRQSPNHEAVEMKLSEVRKSDITPKRRYILDFFICVTTDNISMIFLSQVRTQVKIEFPMSNYISFVSFDDA